MLYAVSKQNQATIDSPTKPHSNGMSLMPDCLMAGSVIPNILMKWGKGVNLIFHEGLESYNHCGWLRGDTLGGLAGQGSLRLDCLGTNQFTDITIQQHVF